MRFLRRLCAAASVLLWGVAAYAEPESHPLKLERRAIEARHVQSLVDCEAVFTVNACRERANTAHRNALRQLREKELAASDARRRMRADAHAQRMAEKRSAPGAGASSPNASEGGRSAVEASKPPDQTPAAADHGHAAKKRTQAPAPKPRPAPDPARRAQFEARQRAAAEHREAVARRNAERVGQKKAAPLPVPASAAGQ